MVSLWKDQYNSDMVGLRLAESHTNVKGYGMKTDQALMIASILSASAISQSEYEYYGRGNRKKAKPIKQVKPKADRTKRIAEKHARKKQRSK